MVSLSILWKFTFQKDLSPASVSGKHFQLILQQEGWRTHTSESHRHDTSAKMSRAELSNRAQLELTTKQQSGTHCGDPVFTQTDSSGGQTARSAQDRMQANSCLRPFSAFLLLVVLPGSSSSSLLPGDRVELFARAVHSLIPGHGAWSEAGKIVVLHYFSDPRCCSWRTPT